MPVAAAAAAAAAAAVAARCGSWMHALASSADRVLLLAAS